MDIIALKGSISTFHRSESDIAIENLWINFGLFLIESIVKKCNLGVMLPLLSLICSRSYWVNLDLLSKISYLLTLLENVNHILHSRLTVDSEVNIANLSLIFLDLF